MLDITDSSGHQKQGLKTSDVRDIEGTFVVKLYGQNSKNYFFYAKLPLNEDDNSFEEQLKYISYKKMVKKLHDDGWKNSYFTSTDVYMLGYGCGVSQYPQLYVRDLYLYHVLQSTNLWSFDGGPGYKLI